ncbi:hypothetical protein C8R44DRAFT_805263 [Mycena epipterygia]|nr:hypothetical protein C8R44DRAFT_805263 [Mycena epipterygia]
MVSCSYCLQVVRLLPGCAAWRYAQHFASHISVLPPAMFLRLISPGAQRFCHGKVRCPSLHYMHVTADLIQTF